MSKSKSILSGTCSSGIGSAISTASSLIDGAHLIYDIYTWVSDSKSNDND